MVPSRVNSMTQTQRIKLVRGAYRGIGANSNTVLSNDRAARCVSGTRLIAINVKSMGKPPL